MDTHSRLRAFQIYFNANLDPRDAWKCAQFLNGVAFLRSAFPWGVSPFLPSGLPPQAVDARTRIQAIFAQYGNRLTDSQKADIRRLATEAQPPLDRLRAFATDNGDGPGLYLKPLMEREKKPSPTPQKPANAPKRS